MAKFTVRVELRGYPTESDYDTLHAAMAEEGFLRVILDESEQRWYKLPPAEYNKISNETREVILARAERAAARTGNRYSVLVTDAVSRTWAGLERVE